MEESMKAEIESLLRDMIESGIVVRVGDPTAAGWGGSLKPSVPVYLSQRKPESIATKAEIQNRTKHVSFGVNIADADD